jgi:hypothetical protein
MALGGHDDAEETTMTEPEKPGLLGIGRAEAEELTLTWRCYDLI